MNPMVWKIIWMVVAYYISTALQPRPKDANPAAFDDFDFPLSEEGTEQAAVFGQVWTTSWQVLTVGNYRTSAIKSKGSKK